MDETFQAALLKWQNAALAAVEVVPTINAERTARKELIGLCADLKEGANTYPLGNGYSLKVTYKIDRKVLVESLTPETREAFENCDVALDDIIRWKPELNTAVFKALTPEQQVAVSTILEIKPGSHTCELVPPKKGKA